MAENFDLVVVGGGPAGLAAAIGARMQGLTVAVLDQRHPPIDCACGEGIMPDGVARLHSLGVTVPAEGSSPFCGIRYIDGDIVAEGFFPRASGYGIRRTHLHRALVDRAEAVAVDLRWDTKVTGLQGDCVESSHGRVFGRVLIGADGRLSHVRKWAGLDRGPARGARFGIRRHFSIKPWTDLVEVHWTDGCEAYVTPVGPGTVGVALLWPRQATSFDQLLAKFPRLADRLDGAPVESTDRGAGPLEQRCRAVVRGNLALLGDASGSLDAITGEGLTLAFHQAHALVAAIQAGDLESYAVAHRQLRRGARFVTSLILFAERRPRLRRRMVRALAADPSLFSRFLEIQVNRLPLSNLGVGGVFRLARHLMAP
jgi:flavin-dependent dehydrogenase